MNKTDIYTKVISKLVFTLMLTSISSCLNAYNIVYSSLILQPKIKASSTTTTLSKFLLSSVPATAAGYLGFKAFQLINEEDNVSPQAIRLAAIAGGITFPIVWLFFKNHFLAGYQVKSAEQFIKYWPEYKNNSPVELHKICDHYYQIYKKNPYEFRDQALTFVSLIENYYKQDNGFFSGLKSFFDRKLFNSSLHADLGSTLNGVSNVIKSFKSNRR